jgi:hypothetical protein
MDAKSLSKLVQRFPSLFSLGIDTTLEPKLKWMKVRLGVDDKSLSFVIQRMPSLLGFNIDTNLDPTIKFYEDCV